MDVSEAALWFNTVPVDGWDGASWNLNVGYGDFHSFDRFITERTFGAKKRVFHAPEANAFDPTVYPVVRTPDGITWVVVSNNADIEYEGPYAHSYILLEAPEQAELVKLEEQTSASGAPIGTTEVTVATLHCDVERYSGRPSEANSAVVYGYYEITLPHGATPTIEQEIKVNGQYFEIKEVVPELLTVICRCLKRG